MASALTLYGESTWLSPWVFHAMVAIEEKQLQYKLEVVSFPMSPAKKAELVAASVFGKVPILVHGDAWITESLAISEYLAETFPAPGHPRLFPADLAKRARARQIMSYLRTGLFALREDRPTSTVFGRPTMTPLSDKGKAEAAELVRIAAAVVAPGNTNLFAEWCIADADLSLMLMRLIANQDPLPSHLIDYALAQWDRKSVRRYIAHLPTSP
jgi:glutathione S-transferase